MIPFLTCPHCGSNYEVVGCDFLLGEEYEYRCSHCNQFFGVMRTFNTLEYKIFSKARGEE